jgi:hypothetical protein
MPPDFETQEEVAIKQSPFQRELWRVWSAMIDRAKGMGPFDLVLNGDLIEGMHHKTTEVWSADPADHVLCAWHVLQRVADMAENVYVVRGTAAHTGASSEHGLAIKLGAVLQSKAKPAFDRLEVEWAGCPCVFIHHMPTTARPWTEATGVGINAAMHQLAAVRAGDAVPRVIVAGHRHRFGLYRDEYSVSVALPAWQGLTRFGSKVVPQARTTVGMVWLDWSGLKDGSLPRVDEWVETVKAKGVRA